MLIWINKTASGLGQHLRLKAPIERDRFVPPYPGLTEVGVPGISDPMVVQLTLSRGGVRRRCLQPCQRRRTMIKLIAVTLFCLSVTVSAQAMTPAPISLPQPDAMITEVAVGCGPGRTRVDGICVARTTIRQTRRAVRRCVRWQGGVCAVYQ